MNADTLLLNGSPSMRGQSMALANMVLQGLPPPQNTVHLYRENISPCLDCQVCSGGTACPIPDAMPKLLSALTASNLIIVASPLHFTSLTAPVIAFFSRLQPFWRALQRGEAPIPPRRRLAALVVTGGGEYPDMFRPARSVAAAAFKSLGLEFIGMAAASNTDILPVEENSCAKSGAEALRDSIVKVLL